MENVLYPRVWKVMRPKFLWGHVGLCIEDYGVFENSPERGRPGVTNWENFNKNNDASSVELFGVDVPAVMMRIQAMMNSPERYTAAFFNCEHAVSQALTGRRESPQLRATLTTAALVTVGVMAFGPKGFKA